MTNKAEVAGIRAAAFLWLRSNLQAKAPVHWHDALTHTYRAMLGCEEMSIVLLQTPFVEAIKRNDRKRALELLDEMEKAPRKADV